MLRKLGFGVLALGFVVSAPPSFAQTDGVKEPVRINPLPRGTVPPYVPPKLITASLTRGTFPDVMEPEKKAKPPKTPALYETAKGKTKTNAGDLPDTDNAPVGLVDEEELGDPTTN